MYIEKFILTSDYNMQRQPAARQDEIRFVDRARFRCGSRRILKIETRAFCSLYTYYTIYNIIQPRGNPYTCCVKILFSSRKR